MNTYLTPESPAGDAAVTRKGPELARGGGQHTDRSGNTHCRDDRGHDCGAGNRPGCLEEDSHEGVSGWGVHVLFHVAETEKHGEQHAETEGSVDQHTQHDRRGDGSRSI